MASAEASVVRDLVHRLSAHLSAHPPAHRRTDSHGFVAAAALEEADLRDVVQNSSDELTLAEAVQELQSLVLPRSSIGDQGVTVLMRALKEGSRRGSSLRYLDLSDNGITAKGFEALTDALGTKFLPNLETLILSQNKIGEEGVNMLAKVLRNGQHSSLRGLDLSYCNIGTLGMMSLADGFQSGMFSAFGMESLDLSANGIEGEGIVALSRAVVMGRLPKLRFLSLSGNDLGEDGTRALSGVFESGNVSGLTHLLLSVCYMTDGLVPIAQSLVGLPNLQVLELSGNHMGDHGSVALAKALRTGRISRLQQLNLSQCGIGADQVDVITKAIEAGQVWGLRYLNLSYNSLISDSSTSYSSISDGVVAIVRLIETGYLSSLEYLDLSNCSITDIGLIELAQSMSTGKLPALQHFLLEGNDIRSTKAIKALVRALESGYVAYLEELELGQNSVGEDATLALASALTVSSAQGPLVESLKSRLLTDRKSLAHEGTVRDQVKKVWRNKSFRALGVIRVAEEELPTGEKLYNRASAARPYTVRMGGIRRIFNRVSWAISGDSVSNDNGFGPRIQVKTKQQRKSMRRVPSNRPHRSHKS